MTEVLFIQGGGASVHDGWDNRLVQSLERELGPGFRVRYPRLPHEDDPRFASWKPAILRELDALGRGAFVVAHSVGATVLLHALAEEPRSPALAGLVLVAAPFVGPGGWASDDIQARTDLGERLPATLPISFYHGTDDTTAPVDHVHLYARAIPSATIHVLDRRDHQLNDDLGEVAREIRSLAGH